MSACNHGLPELAPPSYTAIDFGSPEPGDGYVRYQGSRSDVICKLLRTSVPPLPVVIKAIRTQPNQESKRAIDNEMRIWRLLDPNLNIAHFLGTGQLDIWPFDTLSLVSEHYKHGDVNKFLEHNDLNDISRVELIIGALRGILYIHTKSIIHGDLKGANIVIDSSKTIARICDFGSSLIGCDCYHGPEEQDGTVQWDSPELFEDNRRTHLSDIWAFGCVILEILMGMPPYGGIGYFEVAQYQEDGLPPATEDMFNLETQPGLRTVWGLMQKCWEFDPSKRPDASKLLLDFELVLDEMLQEDEGYMSLGREAERPLAH